MAAAKKAAPATGETVAKKARKPTAAKSYGVRLDDGAISGPFSTMKDALDDVQVSATATSTVTLYREVKSGKLTTKVKLA